MYLIYSCVCDCDKPMDADDEINYKTLRKIQQSEAASPLLTKLDHSFYERLLSYSSDLAKLVKKEENPSKQKLISDEIQNITKIANGIYEQREKKIVQAALSNARGGKPDVKHMLAEEKQFFVDLVAVIGGARKTIFEKIQIQPVSPVEKKPSSPENPSEEKNNNPLVRVTVDIPAFVGPDMKTYILKKQDILSIPKEIAEPLKKRGVVQPLI